MKIFKPIFMLMALCAGICVSCDKEDDVNNGGFAPEGEAVHFAAGP
ncbi:MAG: hypothetical protein HUK02_08880, partial [Bacteroidaceae bacterium]|nr:hypothetical protein [Bacteroidaceae bacterium]